MLRMPNALGQLAVLIALGFPSSAAAATLGELPFQRAPDGAACLAPTGAPGELSRWAEGGAEVLAARRAASDGRRWWLSASSRAARERPRTPAARPSSRARRRTRCAWRCASRAAGASACRSRLPRRRTSSSSASLSPHMETRWWPGRSGRQGGCGSEWRGATPAPPLAHRRSSCHGGEPRWGGAGRDGGGRRERRARPRADRHRGESGEHRHRALRRAGSAVGACHVSAAGGLRPCARRRAGRTRRAGSDDSSGSVSVLERPRGGVLGAPQRLTDSLAAVRAGPDGGRVRRRRPHGRRVARQ